MISPTNRFIAVIYAVFGIMFFAVILIGPSARLDVVLQVIVTSSAIWLAIHSIFRRDMIELLIAAGLGCYAVTLLPVSFNPVGFGYVGAGITVAGFLLLMRRSKNKTTTHA
jgi:uncharacterized MnhB-related membrane protein